MAERAISPYEIRQVVKSGTTIANYPDDLPYPSQLILAFIKNRPLHVVAADDHEAKVTYIITAYEPTLVEWEIGFSKRLQK